MTTAKSTLPVIAPEGGAVPVTIAPSFDPVERRIKFVAPCGSTIADILAMGMSELPPVERIRVDMVTRDGFWMVDRRFWHIVRPNAGVHVVVRIVPGGQAMRSVLSLLVSVVATALTGPLATLLGVTSAFGKTLITAALVTAGGLLLNALFPQQGEKREKPNYILAGWQNEFAPDAPIPLVLGKIRYAPRYGARTYTEVVRDRLYMRTIWLEGYGPLVRSKPRIGRTDLDKFDEIEFEDCDGVPIDTPFELYPAQVLEESQGLELVRELEEDDYGEPTGPYIDKPVSRFTVRDAAGFAIIWHFENGLSGYDDGGFFSSPGSEDKALSFKVECRLVGVEDFDELETVTFSENKAAPFFRSTPWAFPVRGQYEIQVTRLTNNSRDANVRDTVKWFAIQSFRPEYPINFDRPLSLRSMRLRGTAQLNGTIDTYNEILSSLARDWNGAAWVVRETKNPAALAIHWLSGVWNPHPAADGEIDWPAFEDWHEECTANDLSFNRVIDFDAGVDEGLAMIGAAGRGAVWFDGEKWTVTIDRPRTVVVDHISSRNASNVSWSTSYFRPPDGHRVTFLDETNDFEQGERIIPWPADHRYATKAAMLADLLPRAKKRAEVYADPVEANNGYFRKVGASGSGSWEVAPLDIVEALDLPGITNPDQIWIEARRLQYERMYRNTAYVATQPGSIRRAGPGDMVMLARDILVRRMHSARVVSVYGRRVEFDEAFEMETGETYAVQWRQYASENDSDGVWLTRTVKTVPGEQRAVTLEGVGQMPGYGDVVHFGRHGTVSIPVIVAGIERGEDNASILHMLPAADEMHARVAAEVPPAWNGRVGVDLGLTSTPPSVPKVVEVRTGYAGTGTANGMVIMLRPGPGAVTAASLQVQHRLDGGSVWSAPVSASGGSGAIEIAGYLSGQTVEWQPRAVSLYGVPSAWGTTRETIIGFKDRAQPKALDASLIVVTGGLGKADTFFTVDTDAETTTHVQLYRNTTGIFSESDATLNPIAVAAGGSYTRVMGDASRVSLLANGDLSAAGPPPTLGANWTISGGKALHSTGAGGSLSWSGLTLNGGKKLRFGFTIDSISGASASITPRLLGGTTVTGTPVTSAGLVLGSLVVISGNNTFAPLANTTAVAQVDGFSAYEETTTSLPQGTNYIWLRPYNQGMPGPLAGPFAVTVI